MNEWQQMQYDRFARVHTGLHATACMEWCGARFHDRPCVYDGPAGRREYVTAVLAKAAGHRFDALWKMSCGDRDCVNADHIVATERKPKKVHPFRKCIYGCDAQRRQRVREFICRHCTRTVRDLTFAIRHDGRTDTKAIERFEEMVSSILADGR